MAFIWGHMEYFIGCFSTYVSFSTFVVIVMGFLARTDNYGVTSFVRALSLHPSKYETLLDFFRSKAVNLSSIWVQWWRCVADSGRIHTLHGKYELIGDDTSVKSCGKRTPGVTKLVNYSETADKPHYFYGHYWGCVGALCVKPEGYYCIPLLMNIQVGLIGIKDWIASQTLSLFQMSIKGFAEERSKPHNIQMIDNTYRIAKQIGPSLVIFDRFFLSSPLLVELRELNKSQHLLDCIMRAKLNIVAYEPPPPRDPHKKGRPRLKGKKKYELAKLFETPEQFTQTTVCIYGKKEDILYYSLDLVWGKKVWMPLRFVLTIQSNGKKSIFVSTDLSLTPQEIIEAYSRRYKIELAFRSIKQVVGGLKARFWSKDMPALDRYAKKGTPGPLQAVTSDEEREKILDTIEAHERFAAVACVALGTAQMIAATPAFAKVVRGWRWLRTFYRSCTVSEETVTYFIAAKLNALLKSTPQNRISQIIRKYQTPPADREKGSATA